MCIPLATADTRQNVLYMAIVAKKLSFIKLAYQQTTTILPNHTMDAVKRNLNLAFTTIARLSKASKKDIPPSYQKPSGKP